MGISQILSNAKIRNVSAECNSFGSLTGERFRGNVHNEI
jgi:hypothetical protein